MHRLLGAVLRYEFYYKFLKKCANDNKA